MAGDWLPVAGWLDPSPWQGIGMSGSHLANTMAGARRLPPVFTDEYNGHEEACGFPVSTSFIIQCRSSSSPSLEDSSLSEPFHSPIGLHRPPL